MPRADPKGKPIGDSRKRKLERTRSPVITHRKRKLIEDEKLLLCRSRLLGDNMPSPQQRHHPGTDKSNKKSTDDRNLNRTEAGINSEELKNKLNGGLNNNATVINNKKHNESHRKVTELNDENQFLVSVTDENLGDAIQVTVSESDDFMSSDSENETEMVEFCEEDDSQSDEQQSVNCHHNDKTTNDPVEKSRNSIESDAMSEVQLNFDLQHLKSLQVRDRQEEQPVPTTPLVAVGVKIKPENTTVTPKDLLANPELRQLFYMMVQESWGSAKSVPKNVSQKASTAVPRRKTHR